MQLLTIYHFYLLNSQFEFEGYFRHIENRLEIKL